ncbi:cytochrome c biogenesis CcdA family protein [Paraburkholderia caribensis]|uniref:cytochrome c biogenesis CcdA family protein n=1 Tax=Paraburkholderia caribensis TaxID=75105 RepID=UPI001CAED886|nr:cytochrome c biogenesis CcdA family protein [Paraburkholderia caribensis]CAG9242824.1 Cytochrome c-type biogenesis protein CcdA (DsbD analog) [Paraburkholderia caribensis]
MDFSIATYGLGLVAGTASVLSPCVLPLLPILATSALAKHRFGVLALASGLAISFAITGTLLATLGASAGLDPDAFRHVAAALMIVFGLVMLSRTLQTVFSRVSGIVSARGQELLSKVNGDGLLGQTMAGLLLGVVWTPCVGPTLGAATSLAAQGHDLGHIAVLMALFGLGAALPLIGLGTATKISLTKARVTLASLGNKTRLTLGLLFVALGTTVVTGVDRNIEAVLLAASPSWLTALTTSL